jgi:hypothetical protein
MKRTLAAMLAIAVLVAMGFAVAQQRPADAPPVLEAKKEVIVNWTLGGQAWDFKAVMGVYEPVKGVFEPLTGKATWTLQIVKDLEPGAAALHNETPGTPFKPVLLTAEKAVMALDAKVEMTAVTGKTGDTIQIDVKLPEKETLDAVKLIRVERRTNVGF